MTVLSVHPILAPILAQAAIFFLMATWAVLARGRALGSGSVKAREVSLETSAYPEGVRKVSNAFNNQFETPVYFFAAGLLAVALQVQDLVMLAAAWTYIASRVAHIAVHVTINRINPRFAMYAVGVLALLVMWVRIGVFAVAGV